MASIQSSSETEIKSEVKVEIIEEDLTTPQYGVTVIVDVSSWPARII